MIADLGEDLVCEVRMRLLDGAVPAAPAVAHRADEERPILDGQEAGLVRPVLEDSALLEEPRDHSLAIDADARGQRDPMAALDGRDRVELDAGDPVDRLLDLACRRRPPARGVALRVDNEAAEGRESDRAHA